jgi:hypothetical protein
MLWGNSGCKSKALINRDLLQEMNNLTLITISKFHIPNPDLMTKSLKYSFKALIPAHRNLCFAP